MVTEIELKAHVHNSEELRLLLLEKAEYLYGFEKKDKYWFAEESALQGGSAFLRCDDVKCPGAGLSPSGLRIRCEKRSYPDGKEESLTLATYKKKELKDGIEVNDEREFTVNPASEFEEFLKRLGLKPERSKEKRGWAFSKNGIITELVEVKGLGWFVELEIIVNAMNGELMNEEAFAQGKKSLMDLLFDLGVTKEAIESRFYSEMLSSVTDG